MTLQITFAIAAYNAAPFIEAALSSILLQSAVSLEVIVVDDASTDETCHVVDSVMARDDRVRLIRNETNLGPAGARNAALSIARGEWFAVVDADDIIAAGRSARLLDLAAAIGPDIVADNLERFDDETGRTLSFAFDASDKPYAFLIGAADYFRSNTMYARRMPFGYLKPMFRMSFLRRGGFAYRNELRIGEDFDLCLRCLLRGAGYVVISEPMYRYRVRTGSLSWRLDTAAVENLIDAYEASMATTEPTAGDRFAGEEYLKALKRARAYVHLVGAVQAHDWRSASTMLSARRDLIPLLINSSIAHVRKRLPAFRSDFRRAALETVRRGSFPWRTE